MAAMWVLLCSLFILLGVEIRLRIAFEQISEWKYGMDRLTEEIKNFRDEIAMVFKDDAKSKQRLEL